jgi:hypothetical protein
MQGQWLTCRKVPVDPKRKFVGAFNSSNSSATQFWGCVDGLGARLDELAAGAKAASLYVPVPLASACRAAGFVQHNKLGLVRT